MTENQPLKNFVNIHILISHSPSCLNRDDMNMQKAAVFGGVKRTRISSQSLKRSIRHSDYYRQHLGDPSIRTRELGVMRQKIIEALGNKYSEDIVTQTLQELTDKTEMEATTRADAVAPWVISEIDQLCRIVQASEGDAKQLKQLLNTNAETLRESLKSGGIDVALSGRMAAKGKLSNVDGAMAVAHSITTHASEPEIDWFTAVDDLASEQGETGSGHLDTQEFSAGVFYRYASINLRQLQKNLGNTDRSFVLSVAAHVVHLMATVVPSAKQNSFGAYNLADFVMVNLGHQPISLANAFESPINSKKEGYLGASIQALESYWNDVSKGYGLEDQMASFSLNQKSKSSRFQAIQELENWLRADGQSSLPSQDQ